MEGDRDGGGGTSGRGGGTVTPAPFSDPSLLPVALTAFLAGLCIPFRYGVERARGFARAVLKRLPYEPPEESAEGRP